LIMKKFIKSWYDSLTDTQVVLLILCWGIGLPMSSVFFLEGWLALIAAILGGLPWIVIPLYLGTKD
jgi:hypothetical protein